MTFSIDAERIGHKTQHLLMLKWQPTPVLSPGKSHGQRSLGGCSPRGHKESDTAERLHFHALGKEMATHPSGLAGKSHGQRSLAGCSLWGCKSRTRLSD